MFPIEAISTIGGLVLPPVLDLIKKIFVKKEDDTPEQTISSLATTKPDVLPAYTEASAKLMEAKTQWFNRDVVGTVSPWVSDLRATIRPATVCLSMLFIGFQTLGTLPLDASTRAALLFIVASWFGGRLK